MLIASTSRSITRIYSQCEIHRHSIYPHCFQLQLQAVECSWTLFRTLTAPKVLRGLFPLSVSQYGHQKLKGCPHMINNQLTPWNKALSKEITVALQLPPFTYTLVIRQTATEPHFEPLYYNYLNCVNTLQIRKLYANKGTSLPLKQKKKKNKLFCNIFRATQNQIPKKKKKKSIFKWGRSNLRC
jgi:hypothetical protein